MQTPKYIGAGIIVIEKGYALAGMAAKTNIFSGIGGKPETNEEPIDTAMREAVEELLGIEPPQMLLFDLAITFHEHKSVIRDGYYMVIFDFNDINRFLKIVQMYAPMSPFYKTFPDSSMRLILDRIPNETAEITELTYINYCAPAVRVDPEFLKDCRYVETKCLCPAQPGAT